MGSAKEIIVKVVPCKLANDFIKKHHYSGSYVRGGNGVHFGCFLDGGLHGVMSFGNPLDKRKVINLVQPCQWNEMLELNRMAFDSHLPKNSESRCLSIAIKLLKKNAPHIKWLLSYADACQCGDGTIYRASGFVLTAIKQNRNLIKDQRNKIVHCQTLKKINFRGADYEDSYNASKLLQLTNGSYSIKKYFAAINEKYEVLVGYQLRYVYIIDKSAKLTVPSIPFSKISEMGAGMYLGNKKETLCVASSKSEQPAIQPESGGELPTATLQFNE